MDLEIFGQSLVESPSISLDETEAFPLSPCPSSPLTPEAPTPIHPESPQELYPSQVLPNSVSVRELLSMCNHCKCSPIRMICFQLNPTYPL